MSFSHRRRCKLLTVLLTLSTNSSVTDAFSPHPVSLTSCTPRTTASTTKKVVRFQPLSATARRNHLRRGDAVLLIGPSFLQLNIAKAAKAASLRPILVAPQTKIDNFISKYVNDDSILADATIGLPDPGEEYYGTVSGVVFCSEEPVLGPALIRTVLDFDGYASDDGRAVRVIACAPGTKGPRKERGMGWIPILNNDKNADAIWDEFVTTCRTHSLFQRSGSVGSFVRYGSLLGGSTDGPPSLRSLGLDERIYKMSYENYRDLKERSFDRFRLGAQVLVGDAMNPMPPNQESMEKRALNGEHLEVFRTGNGYPEQYRANRHTVAQAVVQSLLRPVVDDDDDDERRNGRSVPAEITILSKCVQELPSEEEWDELFANPGAASWPDPYLFHSAKHGSKEKEVKK